MVARSMFRSLLGLAAAATSMAAPPSVLIVLTSNSQLGDHSALPPTGFYLPEAAHSYFVFKNALLSTTFASPKGGPSPVDDGSVHAHSHDKESMDFLKDSSINHVWMNTSKLEDLNPKDFDAVFVVGGYGMMWDVVGNKALENIAASVYERNGVVSGVCHGPAALANVRLSNGQRLISGKDTTCFSNAEEGGYKGLVPQTCQDAFVAAGAKYAQKPPWDIHVEVDGRLVTGQNPASTRLTAQKVVVALWDRMTVV